MGEHTFGGKQVVAGQQNFGHHIAPIPEMLWGLLQTQIIKTLDLGHRHPADFKVRTFAVVVDNRIAVFLKFETDLAGGFDLKLPLPGTEIPCLSEKASLPAAYWPGD